MSLDTRDELASVVGLAAPWGVVMPLVDGDGVTAGDKAQLAYCYRGIVEPPAVLVIDNRNAAGNSGEGRRYTVGRRPNV